MNEKSKKSEKSEKKVKDSSRKRKADVKDVEVANKKKNIEQNSVSELTDAVIQAYREKEVSIATVYIISYHDLRIINL